MKNKVKKIILKNKATAPIALYIHKFIQEVKVYRSTKPRLGSISIKRPYDIIFYIGTPAHSNLGDLAQGICIRHWLKKHYPNTNVIEIETNALVNTRFSLLGMLKKAYREGDVVVFQSGYTTTDLGGYADEMHRAVMSALPQAKMLMLPQTIFFRNPNNAEKTSQCYNSMKRLLFLSRDRVSYSVAKEMFPDISVMLYPDIVTTLIGNYQYDYDRSGILFCCRDDGEKYYSDQQIDDLMNECSRLEPVQKTDTTKKGNTKEIVSHAKECIDREIDQYAHYKLIITDRYHGTILSLVAGTPVIILKTTDHKVTTGAEWFAGIYDDYVYLADSPNHALQIAKCILKKQFDHKLQPYFEKEYYDKLPELFIKATEK